jgi:hypothetical protein
MFIEVVSLSPMNATYEQSCELHGGVIGTAYLHGGLAMGFECMKIFDLGLSWKTFPECINAVYSRFADLARYPTQIAVVESILWWRPSRMRATRTTRRRSLTSAWSWSR